MIRILLTSLKIVLLLISYPVYAEKDKATSWTMSILFENDLFVGTDSNYTNGVKVNWISPDLTNSLNSGEVPDWGVPLIKNLPFINEKGLQRNISFSLGQKIFTPEDISRSDLILDDRPYAGWLYLGAGFHNKNLKRLDTFEIQLGVIGPAALGREAQNTVHDWRGIGLANGWKNQLNNEFGFILMLERKYRAWQSKGYATGLGADLITNLGAAAGNVQTYANVGAEFRFGWNIPTDFGTSLMRPGGDTNAPSDSSDPRFRNSQRFGLYFFIGAAGRLVGRDIFLDGNTFSDSHSVDKKYFVGDAVFGGSVILSDFKLSYARVFRSKEFDQQDIDSGFGSFSLAFTF